MAESVKNRLLNIARTEGRAFEKATLPAMLEHAARPFPSWLLGGQDSDRRYGLTLGSRPDKQALVRQ
ncbi:hypothetical protein [Agrobacterium tumefaciens]|uniref:hypothetical protein n=1 Tax=Agrobacterium tumefaciens TaxID=358 RepID=UPI000DD626C1|nr:hypothetical protein [Agrobacterium tumefaciens]NSZ35595.1 hypothetical protein [Agrobacterium tumefaciens]QLG25629.1 hypothetical protein EML4_25210 [Agrobacterium tumefaciens]UXS89393.1 hypothetical protein FY144_24490 [Agrobacterium tumefaciens]